jgi:protein tyrosine phosphatase (PTP) superfamily phosphohydrolase (DUF442 family)
MTHRSIGSIIPLLATFSLSLCAASIPGVPNFDKVDEHVYRGGQPTDEGFRNLAKLGVKTIVDLRETDERGAAEKSLVTSAGMNYVNVPMTGLTPPTEVEITKILSLLGDGTSGPVFVHCKRGADRTGAVIAVYQINFHKWDNARALKDANAHGMSFFQFPRQRYVMNFRQRSVEASAIAKPADSDAVVADPASAIPASASRN